MRTIIGLKSLCLYWNIGAVQQNRHLSCIVYYFSWTGIKDMKKLKKICCVPAYPAAPKDVFFLAFK